MSSKANDSFLVNAGGGWSYIARVLTHSGANATRANFASISRTITNTVTKQAVTDELVINDVIYDELQSNTALWAQSFNMKDDVPATKISQRQRYTLQYTFTPVSGAVFKTREIDVHGD